VHELIVDVGFPRLVSQLRQIAGVKVCRAKETLIARLHLFLTGLLLQSGMLTVEPAEDLRIVSINGE